MLPTKQDQHNMPTTSVFGDFPVHFHYTAGIAGEKFLYGLKEKKFLATYCSDCDFTYFPGKMFCEDCFKEFSESDWKELEQKGTLLSYTTVYFGHDGRKLEQPEQIGLIKVNGSSTAFFHRLVDVQNPQVGMELSAVWADDRTGSVLDLKGFTA